MKKIISCLTIMLMCGFAHAQEDFAVFFDSDKYELKATEKQRLENFINQNKDVKIVAINGFTDEDGSFGYNDTLAAKRVGFVYNFINGRIKIREDFKALSFGKAHEHSSIKAENRRVNIFYLKAEDIPREDEILGLKKPSEPRQMPIYATKIVIDNPDGTRSDLILDVDFMEKITLAKPGEKFKLDNLNFHLNTFAVTKDSRAKMYELLEVLKQNPQMVIQIQGHICCMQGDRQDLSTQRAKAIRKFLEINGIEKQRVSFKGFGVSQPLYKIPEKNEEERAANRRVEIEIIAN